MGLICRLDMVKRRNRLQKTKERRERGEKRGGGRERCCSLRSPEIQKEDSGSPEGLVKML